MKIPPNTAEAPVSVESLERLTEGSRARAGSANHPAAAVESLEQLTSRVTHELNNQLMVINCYAELLLGSGEFSLEAADSLRQIYLAGETAVKLTRQLSGANLGVPTVKAGGGSDVKNTSEPADNSDQAVILLVDDDEVLRALTVLILQKQGYRVLEAASAAEALEVWQRHHTRIRLLITDVVMPGDMTGRDLATQLQIQKPGLRVIFSTGYPGDLKDNQNTTLLQKPYLPIQLVTAVRAALEIPAAKENRA